MSSASRIRIRRTDELDSALTELTAGDDTNASDVVRTAVAFYHAACRQAWALRDAGHSGGMLQWEVHTDAESVSMVPLEPLYGQQVAKPMGR